MDNWLKHSDEVVWADGFRAGAEAMREAAAAEADLMYSMRHDPAGMNGNDIRALPLPDADKRGRG